MLNHERDWLKNILPQRAENSHKGSFGKLLVVAGSARYRGAATLAASGALRAGAGLVCLASTERVCAAAAAHLPCCTFLPLAEVPSADLAGAGAIAAENLPALLDAARGMSALLLGCGLGNAPQTAQLVQGLLGRVSLPVVLDADGLNALCGHTPAGEDTTLREAGLQLLKERKAPTILTPHVGEMSRLSGLEVQKLEQDLLGAATAFAGEYGCTVVLKSHQTALAGPKGPPVLHDRPNAGLAHAGSGDVLAGIIASLLAEGLEAEPAALAGVRLHSEAGLRAVKKRGRAGLSPADLPETLCEIWPELDR